MKKSCIGVTMQIQFRKKSGAVYTGTIIANTNETVNFRTSGTELNLGDLLSEILVCSEKSTSTMGRGTVTEVLFEFDPIMDANVFIVKVLLNEPIAENALELLRQNKYLFTSGSENELLDEPLPPKSDGMGQLFMSAARDRSKNFLDRCENFSANLSGNLFGDHRLKSVYWFPVTTTGLKNRVNVYDPIRRRQKQIVSFVANSYFGLEQEPRVKESAKRAIDKYGVTTASSAILAGNSSPLVELEAQVAEYFNREDSLVFVSGYQTNVGTISCLLRKTDAVFIDRFAHASIQDGCKMAEKGYFGIFQHNDVQDLDNQLKLAGENPKLDGKLIITDSVFSMQGDIAPLPELLKVAEKHGATLMLDEAHSNGLLGARGRGIEELYNLPGSIPILMGTFGKWTGLMGGFIVGKKSLIDYLRVMARAHLFTRVMPASFCASISTAMRILDDEPERRESLQTKITYFKNALATEGLCVLGAKETAIVSVFIGKDHTTWKIAAELFYFGIRAGVVTYPAQPSDESILRFVVTDLHNTDDLDYAVFVLKRIFKKYALAHKTVQELKSMEAV
jgi:8-amino-7-oxononanoate synthase